jgi:transcriptional regulator with PAS, ATPase and Fis domain
LPRRFTFQGRQACDHWRNETLRPLTVANTPENLARVHKIFAFQSNFMPNIIDFTPDNFQISILTQPFTPSRPEALSRLPAAQAENLLRQSLAFFNAAREWNMDFLDFSSFQLLPNRTLRFAWKLDERDLSSPPAFIPLFNRNRHLHGIGENNCREFLGRAGKTAASLPIPAFLCRREDFASNLLHSNFPRNVKSNANAKIRINTKFSWQKPIVGDNLFHNLKDERTLLLKIDLGSASLGGHLSSLCGRRNPAKGDPAAQAQAFGLFLKKSVFQEVILLIDNLNAKTDDRLLRFLLESGDVPGLTAVLFSDSAPGDCDLEFNEDPPNQMARHLPAFFRESEPPELNEDERDLLKQFSCLEVPVPWAVARRLAAQGDGRSRPVPQGEGRKRPPTQGGGRNRPAGRDGEARITSLLKKRYLQENREQRTLGLAFSAGKEQVPLRKKNELLSWLAKHTDWAYAHIAHFIAGGQAGALEQYLKNQAQESPWQVAPGPACDLIGRYLAGASSGGRILEYFVEILIRSNRLALAEKILAEYAIPDSVFTRLKTAHLAMRRKEYPELGKLLGGIPRVPEWLRDEWLYLNFIYHEKTTRGRKAEAYLDKINSLYYRNLALVQWSDRSIYNREFPEARVQLAGALKYFSARGWMREELETQSQMAKLLRENGRFEEAESLYKTIYVKSEAEGLALNSAYAAVDLGNLYVEFDDDFQAECWYQKALKLFRKEKNLDGIMLVNSNLITILIPRGDWLEVDRLLRDTLAWDEEKRLLNACAIDYLNWAELETLRLNDDRARELIDHAAGIFQSTSNRKGLTECAFLRGRLSGFAEAFPTAMPESRWFSEDQKSAGQLLAGSKAESRWLASLAAMQSKKIRFETMRLLLKKYRNREWLERFKEAAWELSPKGKNYFYYEYWYMHFELAGGDIPGALRDEFLAMHDFFTANKRSISGKLNRMYQHIKESEKNRELFEDARLVEHSRQWRLPEDFFNSFYYEISRPAPVDWLLLAVHEKQQLLFRFSNSDLFRELGEEMLQCVLETPQDQNLGLQEVKTRFRSPERIFFPFANTKMIRWPIAENILACLVVAFHNGELVFQDFSDRHRETFKKFSVLFLNFLQNEYRIHEKLNFIVGESERIRELKRTIAQVSKVDFSLLVTGESGSGKELVARAVHLLSPRASRPFIPVNAAAIPDTLLEAELFGYKKGAFSGAAENRIGLLEAADSGTLFLDEIADLPLALQAKLLRALQEKEVRRLGENKTVPIDVRLISATNKDLEELMRENLFRADLFYRLQDLVIRIPPLRERREDIPPLIGHFLQKFGYPRQEQAKLRAIAAIFAQDHFPGNVRELESKIKKMITFHPELEIPSTAEWSASSLRNARWEFERNLVRNTLNEHSWHKGRTAAKLGISRMALFNLIKKYQIEK